ncbi:laminin subunit alpha-4-like, partial [Empidonax traillii]|uniref:laminin subunit alpha-4-like n=1 Tax=Empidonax traillii TaxID=164674 RepID=UPI000FFD3093
MAQSAAGSYSSYSRKECQEGFYRTSSGKCSPCNCNGNANRCLDGSGICVDCQRNTTGQHCEQCPDGFIGDVVRGVPTFCQPCPCPLPEHSNFAVSCYRKSGSVRCVCKENYAGPNCERCAPGYYGNPLLIGSTCKKCDCNGNSDPNMIFEDCDEVTGQCRNCLHNTSGFKCERCAPGYYGDARFAKNCTACNCGGRMCDSQTGECLADSPEASTDTDCPTISVAADSDLNPKDRMNAPTGSEASSKGLLVQKETIDTNNRATQLVQQLNNIRDNIE